MIPFVGDSSLPCPYSPPSCHGVKNHTTGTVQLKAPEGGFILKQRKKRGEGQELPQCRKCSLLQSLGSVSVLVLKWGRSVICCSLWRNREKGVRCCLMEIELSCGFIRRGLRSRLLMSCSWDRFAGDEGVQVFLLRFQGDADELPGRSSQYIYTHSLATLLGTPCFYQVGPPFVFRSALILRGIDSTRCWKHSSEILVHIDMIASHSCCRFVVCTSMMQISRSTTSQRCSIGLRSGDCGGRLSKVNSLSCSRNQSEMI